MIDFLEGLFDFLGNEMLSGIVPLALHAEEHMKGLGINGFSTLFKIFLDFGISLIILKFLKKGFEIYVLWSDGDADSDPVQLLTNFFRAMIIALSFPVLYGWLSKIIEDFSNEALGALGLNANVSFPTLISTLTTASFFSVLSFLVFFIIFILLYIQFIKKGLEILILRVGLPLACVGLMDADKGVFRSYIQKFFQSTLTVLVQVVLAKLGLSLMFSGHLFWGIAAGYFAIKTPSFLQEFLIFSGGGSMMNTMYSSARLAQMLKSVVK